MAFFGNFIKKANFFEPAKKALHEVAGIDKKVSHAYFSDYADLFNEVIAKNLGPEDGVPLVANYIALKIVDGSPHTNPSINLYEIGAKKRTYDPLILSFIILQLQGDEYAETIEKIKNFKS